MLPSLNMKVNKKHLAIKGHYFLFNAGIAPLVPFLSTYARHLGLSAATVGAMFMILPILSLVSKPLFGYIADRYKLQKAVFLICQVLLVVCFSAVYLVPVRTAGSVELDCGDGASVLRACAPLGPPGPPAAAAAAAALARDQSTALCRMECDMDSPSMWQTVCEHWHIPEYCYSATDSIHFDAHISNVTVEDDHCAYLKTTNVTLDGIPLSARCHAGSGVDYVDVAAPCRLACPAAAAAAAAARLTCRDNWTAFRLCGDGSAAGTANTTCQASCTLDPGAPWRLMELCEGWRGDAAAACRPRTPLRRPFPRRLPFTATAPLNLTMAEHDCVYLRVQHIRMDDGSVHFPTCAAPAGGSLFRARCRIHCDHPLANELFAWSAGGTAGAGAWPLGAAAALGWLAMGGVVAVADAVCNTHLVEAGGAPAGRAWGAAGAALLAAAAGALGDTGSGGGYTASLALLLLFLTAAVLCSLPIRPPLAGACPGLLTSEINALTPTRSCWKVRTSARRYGSYIHHVQRYLEAASKEDSAISYYGYSLKSELPTKVAIRGLPADTPAEDIQAALRTKGFPVRFVRAIAAARGRPGCLFMPGVTIEAWRGRGGPPQCHRCQTFGHASEQCHRPFKSSKRRRGRRRGKKRTAEEPVQSAKPAPAVTVSAPIASSAPPAPTPAPRKAPTLAPPANKPTERGQPLPKKKRKRRRGKATQPAAPPARLVVPAAAAAPRHSPRPRTSSGRCAD
ncbi:unnamed protein product [Plutella xylostella]|uniref:(diamondback moth) hypothetical protein n=1 Tax=Plutella xylostella TaxID=51655 RepID=A0A8S4GCA8_PLUXY|nr:unnamed protein product [Plutella xylostella]